ncbi:MAG: lanthionine synthetase LanC family protein [Planctomycetota bacterium]|jgi:lantibiotic modifying enzyme
MVARVIVAGLLLLVSPASADDYLNAARGIGDYLVKTARHDGDAVYWAQYEGPGPAAIGEELHFPVSLYSGLTGTGYFLLNLHLATGENKYLDAAKGAGRRLLKLAKPAPKGGTQWRATYDRSGRSVPDGWRVGLYTGNAGIGLFLIHLHRVTKDPEFKKGAVAAFARVLAEAKAEGDGIHWLYDAKDIIGGEAGIGLALLEMGRITGDKKYEAAAKKAATWLIAKAERQGDALRWKGFKPYDAGFSHGASGIAFFLESLGDPAARKAARWVETAATPCGEGGLLWRYYAGDPPEGKRNWTMNSWCHGSPGVVRLFVLLHARTGEQRFLDAAVRGAGGICHEALPAGKPRYYNPTYCCGATGCIDTLCDLYASSKEERWLKNARTLADSVVASLREVNGCRVYAQYDKSDQKEKKHPYVPTGFMLGNAGLGQALLRLAVVVKGGENKLVFLADHPFAHTPK